MTVSPTQDDRGAPADRDPQLERVEAQPDGQPGLNMSAPIVTLWRIVFVRKLHQTLDKSGIFDHISP